MWTVLKAAKLKEDNEKRGWMNKQFTTEPPTSSTTRDLSAERKSDNETFKAGNNSVNFVNAS